MLGFINSVMAWVMKQRIEEVQHFMRYPHEVQQDVFKSLVETAQDTAWGKQHGYKDISKVTTFRERVPISQYETIQPWIERQMRGEQNLLWPGKVTWFAKSSGTTNDRSKFIPVTPESLEECHFKGGKDMVSIYVNNYPETQLFTGKNLTIGGSHQINELDPAGQSKYGDVSAVLMANLPFWAQMIRSPSLETALMSEWDSKLERMADEASLDNITGISGVPTWTILLIERILQKTGAKNILEVWPNLELFIHGAVAFTPYEALFQKLIPSADMHYLEVYNATEGFFGIQDQKDSKEMLLMLDYGIFYEFIPMEEFDKDDPKVLSLDEVELDKSYALVISTNSGLWRYNIGDTVKFTSIDPYRIKITGRTKHFINAFGEELNIETAEKGIATACNATGAIIDNFTAAPVYFTDKQSGRHEWLIEFSKAPDDLQRFTELLDQSMRQLNSDYDAKRYRDMALKLPLVKVVPEGTFYRWMKKRGKLGGQHKVPRLSNSREHLEDILALLTS